MKDLEKGQTDVYVINYANGDMVGHTGNLPAAIKAVEVVDDCLGKILARLQQLGGIALVLADHGNCEQMWDPINNCPHTSHTTYDVRIIVVDDRFKGAKLREGGRLADVAPTALKMLGLSKPPEMTGESLVSMSDQQSNAGHAKIVEVADGNTTPVVRPPLEYQTPKAKPTSFFSALVGGAMLLSSHTIALCMSLVLLGGGRAIGGVCGGFHRAIYRCRNDQSGFGRPAVFSGRHCIYSYFWPMHRGIQRRWVVNIVLDTVRRLLHWPFWISPVGVAGLSDGFVVLTVCHGLGRMISKPLLLGLPRYALLPMLALTAIFCVYWIPLTFTGAVLRVLQWTSKKTWRAFREKRAARKAKLPAP